MTTSILSGRHEFKVLSPVLVRIRFNPKSGEASINPLIENLPACPDCSEQKTADGISLSAGEWILTCKNSADERLEGISLELDGIIYTDLMTPDTRNLGGILRGLDTCDGWIYMGTENPVEKPRILELPNGLLSRRGWTLLAATAQDLSVASASDADEFYLFIYGGDYLSAVRNLYMLTGRSPLLPRWTLGTWYSRFQPLAPEDYRQAVEGFRSRGMGLDVIVGDMSWHSDNWYSLEYNRDRFPDMKGFIKWAKDNHLHLVFNHHPGGLETADPRFAEFVKRCGLDMETVLEKVRAENAPENFDGYHFDYNDPKLFEIYWDIYLRRLLDDGVEMHWIDGDITVGVLKQYYDYTQKHSPSKRTAILSRQKDGSLLNHKFPIAFSGDTRITWTSLETTVALTVSSAAQGVMWSHDIGGHYIGIPDEELFCRWMQSGVFSNFMRLHGSGGIHKTDDPALERRPWERGENAEAVGKYYIPLRYSLLPYIETAMRVQHDAAVPLTCPLYMKHPECENAYRFGSSEYYFGPDIIVAPVVNPGREGVASRTVWLPQGQWQDWFTGELVEGGDGFQKRASILEMPIYLRAGAVIPLAKPAEYSGNMAECLRVIPSTKPGVFTSRLYEDDGESMDYTQRGYRRTEFTYERTATGHCLTIEKADGDFSGACTERPWRIEVKNIDEPSVVKYDGKNMQSSEWSYDAAQKTLNVNLPQRPVNTRQIISFQ